jgi:hypothetical protein
VHVVIRGSNSVLLLLIAARAAIARRRIEYGLLCAAVLLACSAGAIHADVSERFAIPIRLRFDSSLTSRRIIGRLKAETEAIWAPYGVRLEWTDADDSESAANSMSLDARVERQFERGQAADWPAALGRAVVTPDAGLRQPIRVSFDATQRALTLRTTVPLARVVLDSELARALGRVLAHEIGHVLLGPPHHDQGGLMRASFRPEELGDPDRTPFRLTCRGLDRLRDRLRALSGEPQRVHQHSSPTPDLGEARGQRSESSVGASCIPTPSTN